MPISLACWSVAILQHRGLVMCRRHIPGHSTDGHRLGCVTGDQGLLGAAAVRSLARELEVTPTKHWGQNFVVDANTVTRIVRLAQVTPSDVVLEIGPGLGSLTLALLDKAASVTAIEIDPVLAAALPATVARWAPGRVDALRVITADALQLREVLDPQPTALIANLPYNVSVPVVLQVLASLPTVQRMTVMVQAEVGERLAAAPGSKIFGIPSLKVAWFARAEVIGRVPRSVFWPMPRVDSVLVGVTRHAAPATTATREQVFACVDAAFLQRRKSLRAALSKLAGSANAAQLALERAGIDPAQRGEQLTIADFASLTEQLSSASGEPQPGT